VPILLCVEKTNELLRLLLRLLILLFANSLNKATLDSQTSIRQVLSAIVANLLIPVTVRALVMIASNYGSSFLGGINPDSAILVIHLNDMEPCENEADRTDTQLHGATVNLQSHAPLCTLLVHEEASICPFLQSRNFPISLPATAIALYATVDLGRDSRRNCQHHCLRHHLAEFARMTSRRDTRHPQEYWVAIPIETLSLRPEPLGAPLPESRRVIQNGDGLPHCKDQ
jgi:hypothetical protein